MEIKRGNNAGIAIGWRSEWATLDGDKKGNNVEIAIGWRSKGATFEWRSKETTTQREQL